MVETKKPTSKEKKQPLKGKGIWSMGCSECNANSFYTFLDKDIHSAVEWLKNELKVDLGILWNKDITITDVYHHIDSKFKRAFEDVIHDD
jgi:hypothetical protein